jgi:hypothetical protein
VAGHCIRLLCDNTVVVEALKTQHSKSPAVQGKLAEVSEILDDLDSTLIP